MRSRHQPVDLIVRRGALRRFHKLTQRAVSASISVSWDRRVHDRRAASGPVADDRRNTDRRRNPPFTWELGDFVIVGRARSARRARA
jgi:hypothetical protein